MKEKVLLKSTTKKVTSMTRRMLLLALSFLVSITITSCGQAKADYMKKVNGVSGEMSDIVNISSQARDRIVDVWNDAIDNNQYNGEYVDDFNTALQKEMSEGQAAQLISQLEEYKSQLEKDMKELRDYPSSCKDVYNDLVETYGEFCKLYNDATNPSGSLMTYSQSSMTDYQNADKAIQQFNIKYQQDTEKEE